MAIEKSNFALVESFNDAIGYERIKQMYYTIFIEAFHDENKRPSLEELFHLQTTTIGPFTKKSHIIHLMDIDNKIIGSIIFTTFIDIGMGIIQYIVVDKPCRDNGLSNILLQKALDVMRQDIHNHSDISNILKFVFAEIIHYESDGITMFPPKEYMLLNTANFKKVDIHYRQPPLKDGLTPIDYDLVVLSADKFDCIKAEDVKQFVTVFFQSLFLLSKEQIDENINYMYVHIEDAPDPIPLYRLISF